MTKRVVVILIGLPCLWGLGGCAGTEPRTSPAPGQAEPAESDERTNDPNERRFSDGATVELPQLEAPPTVEQEQTDEAEPNSVLDGATAEDGAPQHIDAELEATSPAEPGEAADGDIEPNSAPAEREPIEAEISEPADPEPNEPVEAQPVNDQASALPAFIDGYETILNDYVRENGRVDYSSIDRRRLELKRLLMHLNELDPNVYNAWPAQTQLAFWINAYNLKMLEVIARNYPIQSSWWLRLTWPPSDIRHIEGIWTDYRFIVMDEEFTLREVERRFFRKTFGDPRVFLAITYASRSGPPLRRTVYFGENLDRQLDQQVKRFLASSQGLRIDRQSMTVHLSALFKATWRGKEFVARYGTEKKFKAHPPETRAVLNFITHYLASEDVYFLEVENYSLEYMNYDWRLNDTSRGY
jgi:hypothetical protein